jgi:SAM-dependent methyltransferase
MDRTETTLTEHTGASYAGKARRYAETVDSKPWNAFYERPATLSLLPPLKGLKILDAGCGSGWYAEHLFRQGGRVTAIDLDADFVALTKARVGKRTRVIQANLAEPLAFAKDKEFDLVVAPLVMHYLRDWEPVLREFHRVLRPAGLLVLSTHHPTMDWKLFNASDYFALELLEDEWEIGTISYYRRPLTAMSEALHNAGFVIERLLEPKPTEGFRKVNPDGFARLVKNPWFLVIRCSRGP